MHASILLRMIVTLRKLPDARFIHLGWPCYVYAPPGGMSSIIYLPRCLELQFGTKFLPLSIHDNYNKTRFFFRNSLALKLFDYIQMLSVQVLTAVVFELGMLVIGLLKAQLSFQTMECAVVAQHFYCT